MAFFFSVSASVALYYLLPFDLSGVQHIPAALSGSIFLIIPLGMTAMGMAGGYLTDRYQAKAFILLGSGLVLVGALALTIVATAKTSDLIIAGILLLIGMGIGLFSSPISTVIMSAGGREMMGAASTLTNLSTRLGTVFSPLAMEIMWSMLASFSAQMTLDLLMLDSLAFTALPFALLLATRMKDAGTRQTRALQS